MKIGVYRNGTDGKSLFRGVEVVFSGECDNDTAVKKGLSMGVVTGKTGNPEEKYFGGLRAGALNRVNDGAGLTVGALSNIANGDYHGVMAGPVNAAHGKLYGVEFGPICYAGGGSYAQIGLVTIRRDPDSGRTRVTPFFGFRRNGKK